MLGNFNICEPEETTISTCGTRPVTKGDRRKTAMIHSFFPHVLEIAQPDYTRMDSTALGIIRTLSRIDHIVSIYLSLMHQIFTATLMSLRTWGAGPFRVITQQYVLSFKSQQLGDTRANAFLAGCPNILFLFPFATASRWPPIFYWSVWYTCRIQGSSWKGQEADDSWTLTENTWQHRLDALNRLYCFACLQK